MRPDVDFSAHWAGDAGPCGVDHCELCGKDWPACRQLVRWQLIIPAKGDVPAHPGSVCFRCLPRCENCGETVHTLTPGYVHQTCGLCGGCLSASHYCGEGEETLGEGVYLPEREPTGGYY